MDPSDLQRRILQLEIDIASLRLEQFDRLCPMGPDDDDERASRDRLRSKLDEALAAYRRHLADMTE